MAVGLFTGLSSCRKNNLSSALAPRRFGGSEDDLFFCCIVYRYRTIGKHIFATHLRVLDTLETSEPASLKLYPAPPPPPSADTALFMPPAPPPPARAPAPPATTLLPKTKTSGAGEGGGGGHAGENAAGEKAKLWLLLFLRRLPAEQEAYTCTSTGAPCAEAKRMRRGGVGPLI